MNRYIIILSLLISGHTYGQPIDYIAYYPFNGNANDESTNTNNGTITGATLTADRFGIANAALQFGGEMTNISINGGTGIDVSGDHTINLWVKRSGARNDIIEGSQGELWFIEGSGLAMEYYNGSTLEFQDYYFNTNPLDDWLMLTFIWENRSFSAYIDGVKLTNNASFGSSDPIPDPINISTFSGESTLDDIRIYSRAITSEEVAELFNEDITDILSFSFTEQTGPAVIDASNHTIDIEVEAGTDLTNLVATFTLSAGATVTVNSVAQISGVTSNDFSNPLIYKVTAQDGTTIQNWEIRAVEFLNFSEVSTVFKEYGERSNAAVADYDNDGDFDVLFNGTSLVGFNPQTELYINNGDGTFVLSTFDGFMDLYRGDSEWVDFDLDGYLDVFITGNSADEDNPVSRSVLYKNNGDGTFSEISTSIVNVHESSVDWGDFNNDGFPDLALMGLESIGEAGGSIRNRIYENKEGGSFEDRSVLENGRFISGGHVKWSDYDKDEDLDLYIAGRASVVISELLQNNEGTFNEVFDGFFDGTELASIAVADPDNDGDEDVVFSGLLNTVDFSTKLYFNNTGAGFDSLASNPFTGVWDGSAAWGDLNGDGNSDLIISGRLDGDLPHTGVYIGDGTGAFTDFAGEQVRDVMHGSTGPIDFDGDGNLDILLVGTDGTTLYENTSEALNGVPGIPRNLTVSVFSESINFSWNPASDQETPSTGLTYNLYLTNLSTGQLHVAASSDTTTGFRRLPKRGSIKNLSWTYKKELPAGDYRVGVQAIDNSFAGSEFATRVFSVSGGTNNGTNFLSYSFPNQTGAATINYESHTINIEVQAGTSLSNLIANFILSPGASAVVGSIDQISGITATDFTDLVSYIVTAEDGSKETWVIAVTESGAPITGNPPADLRLTNARIHEGMAVNSTVGVFWSTQTFDASNSFVYTLVSGSGDTNNNLFNILNSQLRVSLDLVEGSYSIRVQSTNGFTSIVENFTIEVDAVTPYTVITTGNTISDYRIFGVPGWSIRVEDMFPDIFPDGGDSWRIVGYNSENGSNEEISFKDLLVGGKGYWYLNREELSVDLSALNPTGNFIFNLDLNMGWNLIANPFLEELNWSDIISHNVSEGIIISENITPNGVYTYNGAYNVSPSLAVFEGGWIFSAFDVRLELPNPSSSNGGRKSSTNEFSVENSWIRSDSNWQLILNLTARGRSSNLAGIGMRPGAQDNADHFDLKSPPVLFDAFEFGLKDSFELSRNYVSPGINKEWIFTVGASENEKVMLSWDRDVVAELPNNLYLCVTDNNRSYNMQAISGLSLSAGETIKITYGDLTDQGTLDLLTMAYPNPAEDEVNIQFFVDGPKEFYDVHASIYSVDGRLVYSKEESYPSDQMSIIKLEAITLPSGLYFYQIAYDTKKSHLKKLIIK